MITTNNTSAAIAIEGLEKRYQGKAGTAKHALKNISLTIPRGSFFGLLGPNGAGKSTLINILAGMVTKTSGTVRVCGIDMDTHPREARGALGIVPQEVVLDPFFTVEETLEFYAGYFGVRPKDRRTDALLKALMLEDKRNNNSRRLSGGMKRRVLIAKALVHNPPVLILDEPTAGVDVELRTQLWEYVRELNKNGTTVLLTTHYLEEAQELCDQIAIINHGHIIAHDTTRAMMKKMDRKQVIVRVQEVLFDVPAVLQPFTPEKTDSHTLTLTYNHTQVNMSDILAALQQSGLTIADLSTQEPDLEDIFRYLVQHDATKETA